MAVNSKRRLLQKGGKSGMSLPHLLSRLLFGPFEGKRRYQGYFGKLHAAALLGMNYGRGDKFGTSGELEVIRRLYRAALGTHGTTVVFDVGANTGEYSAALLGLFPSLDVLVHAFEPSAPTLAALTGRLGDRKQVAIHGFGLGEENERRDLYASEGLSGLSSVYPRVLDHRNIHMERSESIQLRKLDDFCAEESIERIHFLKLDVEGHELSVLKGAERMLAEGRIASIQWEFGGCNIDSRTFFRDFFYLLKDRYRIYRVVKDGIYPIDSYWESLEIFETTNYFAEIRR
jgi:FkbM family methyltransferase